MRVLMCGRHPSYRQDDCPLCEVLIGRVDSAVTVSERWEEDQVRFERALDEMGGSR
jgi:hypothetical protein